MKLLLSTSLHRWITSAQVRPTAAGAWSVAQSIAIFGGLSLSMRDTLDFAHWPTDSYVPPPLTTVALTFGRVLVLPSLVEESIFRVLLQPPGSSLSRILFTNACFSLYHLLNAAVADHFHQIGTAQTFRDPLFLFLAFALGNLCSYVYRMANYGLWAPVLVHAIPVTIWLSILGGDAILLKTDQSR